MAIAVEVGDPADIVRQIVEAHGRRTEKLDDPAARLHGATLVVEAEFRAQHLDESQLLVDIGLAKAELRRVLDTDPSFVIAQAMLGVVLARAGHFEEAKQQVDGWFQRHPDSVWWLVRTYVAALSGDRETAMTNLKENVADSGTGAFFAAASYGALGEIDKGFAALERARDLRFAVLATAKVNPALAPFRSDPRWPGFLSFLRFE